MEEACLQTSSLRHQLISEVGGGAAGSLSKPGSVELVILVWRLNINAGVQLTLYKR